MELKPFVFSQHSESWRGRLFPESHLYSTGPRVPAGNCRLAACAGGEGAGDFVENVADADTGANSCEGKTFTMGSPKGGYGVINNETEHEVTFSSDYYLGVTTVTRGQFAAFVKDDGYQTDPEKGPGGTAWVDDQKDWIRDKKFSWRKYGLRAN